MFIVANNSRRGRPARLRRERPGVVLLVVIAMLALFAALGLSFVYYAQFEADSANMSTQAQTQNNSDIDPEFLLSYGLGQLLLGVDDISAYGTNNNVFSALRGHDLARNMYGYNRAYLNVTPFNGVPRTAVPGNDPQVGQPYANLVNRQYFPGDGPRYFGQPDFVLDPDRYGVNRTAVMGPNFLTQGPPPGQFYVGHNVPWTYADTTNMYLGQINGTGQVLIQSFWRPWTLPNGAGGNHSLAPADPLWRQYDATQPALAPAPWKKYATLRPVPWFNRGNPNNPGVTGFPAPADATGDVKNLDFAPGGNDSIWIDLGFPVRVGPNGQRYKPLFAFFIMDLDGKVNLNVTGNLRRQANGNYEHGSNLGLGPWEVNPNRVLTGADWRSVLHHRYDQNYQPGGAANATNTTPGNAPPTSATAWYLPGIPPAPPFYAFMDFDGVRDNYTTSDRIYLPGDATGTGNQYANNGSLIPFPYIPATSYGGGAAVERISHPALFSPINPNYVRATADGGSNPPTAANDRLFRLSELEALYRYRGTGSPMLTSNLFRVAPQNFNDPAQGQNRRLNVTLLSADLARPGLTPWLPNPPQAMTPTYQLNPAVNPYPTANAWQYAPPPNSPGTGEFGPDYRGWAGLAKRLDINRPLTAFPTPDGTGRINTADPNLPTAIQDRRNLAQDIFNRLRFVTTGARSGAPITDPVGSPQYNALRWLAQLAVNIVDLRDLDNVMTTFVWDTATPAFVVGTELPRLTVNEAYGEVTIDPADPMNPMAQHRVNFWVELINPLLNDIDAMTGQNKSIERLQVPGVMNGPAGWAAYKLLVLPQNDPSIYATGNVTGVNAVASRLEVEYYTVSGAPATMDDADHFTVDPLNQATFAASGTNNGFYVLGPQDPFPAGMNPMPAPPTATLVVSTNGGMNARNSMSYNVPAGTTGNDLQPHMVLLRRLANPGLPHRDETTAPAVQPTALDYNPYITVDFLEHVPVQDGVSVMGNGNPRMPNMNANFHAFQNVNSRRSVGRVQPYAALSVYNGMGMNDNFQAGSQVWYQTPMAPLTAQPQHTFFSHNTPRGRFQGGAWVPPFDWLVHLDRNFASPMDVLHVSGYAPYNLTQRFVTNNVAHSHRAPWNVSDARIYRFLEFLDAGYRMAGVSQDGRLPGKININTADAAVFQALCDENASVNFNGQAAAFGAALINSRTPGGTPGANDRPFRSLANAHQGIPGDLNDGVEGTILRNGAGGTPLLSVPTPMGETPHPYNQNELLSKIFNNVTTRSNVFAVWMTVGFFEVHEWSNAPAPGTHYELGKEIGKDDNRHIRHRMFSIVDRTELVLPNNSGPDGYSFRNVPAQYVAPAMNNPSQLIVPAPPPTYPTPQAGDQIPLEITYQNGTTDMVIVTVTQPPPNSWTFINVPLPLNANQTVLVTLRGNPGPQLRFDHRLRQYAPVVPYYSIIQ